MLHIDLTCQAHRLTRVAISIKSIGQRQQQLKLDYNYCYYFQVCNDPKI